MHDGLLFMQRGKLTPQTISDHKRSWLPGYQITLHSDLEKQGKAWCKKMLSVQSWHFQKYTNVYEHTFCFEHQDAAQNFEMEFSRFTNPSK